MTRKNWYWDINLPYKKIEYILAHEDDPRFPRIAGSLLSRVQDPKQVFELISPKSFCRRYYSIQNEITSDEWTKERAAFWKATYLRLSEEFREQGERIREPEKIELNDFERALIEKVKDCRKATMMTQEELAERMEYSQQYISGIETGREKISLDFLKKLSEVTNQQIEFFLEKNVIGSRQNEVQDRVVDISAKRNKLQDVYHTINSGSTNEFELFHFVKSSNFSQSDKKELNSGLNFNNISQNFGENPNESRFCFSS